MNIFPSTVWVTRAGIHLLNCVPHFILFFPMIHGEYHHKGKKIKATLYPR